ncbi:exopolysaccharide biosynthesis protein [Spirochaetia bacterium]|nr:exopolysaccharide biosynthesis protein [Spirochaetia bacterium]
MREQAKILICVHKKYDVRNDELYMPVHAGKALSKLDLGIQGDDTGDNISEKNPYYSELTVHYWAWKNLKKVDYIGLCHYRRYLDLSSIKEKGKIEFNKIFSKYDIILSKRIIFATSNALHFTELTTREDLIILINVIRIHYPKYEGALIDNLYNTNMTASYNIFLTSWNHFEDYSSWLFSVLSLVERNIKPSGYNRLKRILGYMGEILLPVYCKTNGLKIKYLHIVSNPDMKKVLSIKSVISNMAKCIVFKICWGYIRRKKPVVEDSVVVGLKNDGIDIVE